MNARQHIDRLGLLSIWLGSMMLPCDAAELQPAYSILPASILNRTAFLASDDVRARRSLRGLTCSDHGCELRSIKLKFRDDADQHQTEICHPRVKTRKANSEFTVALLGGTDLDKRKAVPTWFTLRTPRNSDDVINGSLGVTVHTPAHSEYRLVPRWDPDSPEFISFYLETKIQRQRIGQMELKALEAELKPGDILIWAGDLDVDGKIDLITRAKNGATGGGLQLWLSSLAQDGDLVGLAASLDTWIDVDEGEGEGCQ